MEVIRDSSFKARVLKGLMWMSGGALIKIFLQIFFMALLARLLGTEDYGVFAIVLLFVSIAQLLTDSGVGASLIQAKYIDAYKESSLFYFNLLIGSVLSFLTLYFSDGIAVFFNDENLIEILPIISIVFVVKGIAVVPESLLVREMKFKQLALRNTLSYFVSYIFIAIPMAYYGYGVWALVCAQLLTEIMNVTLLVIFKKHNRNIRNFKIIELKKIFRFSSGILLTSLINKIAVNLDTFLVGKLLGMSMLGSYNRAYQLMSYPANLMGGVFSTVLFPALSSIDCKKELRTRHYQILVIMSFLLMPSSLLIFFVSEPIVFILLGSQWYSVVIILKILSLAIYFRIGYKINGVIARAVGQVYKLALCQVLYVLYVFLGCYIGSGYGLPGIAYGMLTALFLQFITKSILGCHITGLTFLKFIQAHFLGGAVCLLLISFHQLFNLLGMNSPNKYFIVILNLFFTIISFAIVFWFTKKEPHYSFIFSFLKRKNAS